MDQSLQPPLYCEALFYKIVDPALLVDSEDESLNSSCQQELETESEDEAGAFEDHIGLMKVASDYSLVHNILHALCRDRKSLFFHYFFDSMPASRRVKAH